MTILLVALGGAGGAVARFAISLAALKYLGTYWPWGTLIANLLGCLLLGLLTPFFVRAGEGSEGLRMLLAVGFLGSLTTFSTLCFELVQLAHNKHLPAALAYAAASLLGGVLLAAAGWWSSCRLLTSGCP